MTNGFGSLVGAAVLAVGIALAGWWIGEGFRAGRADDRYAVVKGLAEREVQADLALWPIRFVVTNNDLAAAQKEISDDTARLEAFLGRHGLGADAIAVDQFSVTDLLAERYRSGPIDSRYILEKGIMVRTGDVDKVTAASQHLGDVVAEGVILSGADGSQTGPTYIFTKLNEIKPEMIAEATKNARAAAQQFAADSGANVGPVRRASQGIFEILARDEAQGVYEQSQRNKKVRVVSTLEFFLAP
jgi:uncharacterized protein